MISKEECKHSQHSQCPECHKRTLCVIGSPDTEVGMSCHNCGWADGY